MFRKYQHKTPTRQHSFIHTSDGCTHTPIGRPASGNSAYTRFFGAQNQPTFVVKRPKYFDQFGEYDARKQSMIETALQDEYRNEQQVWNLLYPDKPAQLVTEGGLRLILPYISGETLTSSISSDELTGCKQLLSVAYAIRRLHQLGFKYTDFNTDNVLIKQNRDGSFQAYLIDLNNMQSIKSPGGCQEILALNIMAGWSHSSHQHSTIDSIISTLEDKIVELSRNKHCASNALQEATINKKIKIK